MMNREKLRMLLEDDAARKVSIYLPTARKNVETMQGPIRLKNLIRLAEQQLERLGTDEDELKRLLKPLRELVGDFDFWQHQLEGLALFRSHNQFQQFRTPMAMPEVATAGERYHIKPLLSWMAADGEFYIFALSLNGVRLFRATRHSAEPVSLPEGMPDRFERPGDQPGLQGHITGPGQRGYQGTIVHGGAGEELDVELEKFLRATASGLAEILKSAPAPVVMMMTDSLASEFRRLYRGTGLLQQGIGGSPEGVTPQKLHELAWPVAERHFAKERQAAASALEDRLHSRQASTEIQQVLIAATEGRVATLFVPVGRQLMGTFNGTAVTLEGGDSPAEDLLDLAATRAYTSGADVYAVPPGSVPGKGDIAALFRY
jgi:hypothetical protein